MRRAGDSRRRAFAGFAAVLVLLPCVSPAATPVQEPQVQLPQPAAAPPPPAWGLAVEGSDFARLRLPAAGDGGPAIETYANAGYALKLETAEDGSRLAVIEVDVAPLGSQAPFALAELAEGVEPVEVGALARQIVAGAGSRYEAVSAVLGWMVHHVVSEETAARAAALSAAPAPAAAGGKRAGSEGQAGEGKAGEGQTAAQTPEAVLERGSGSAAGIAALAVALLKAAGLDARAVRGRVVGPPEVGSPRGPHTWIEVRYPRLGWVFSDPLYHHHYVPANYVRFAEPPAEPDAEGPGAGKAAAAAAPEAAGEAAPAPAGFELAARRDRRQTVDLYPAGAPGVTARKNDAAQRAGALRVVVSGAGRGSAVLEGAGGRRSKMLVAGESVFVGLEGGAYRLEVYLEGRPPIVRQLEVGERERRAVFLRRADGGGDEPEVTEQVRRRSPGRAAGRPVRPAP